MSNDSRTDEERQLTRRSTLQTLGTLLAAGGVAGTVAGVQDDGSYRVVQGGETHAVEPLSGDVPVERFYGFHLPDEYTGTGEVASDGGAFYESTGTRELQRDSTTITFLYDGPNGLSLVVVHGNSTTEGEGGAVTWDLSVRPRDARWLVKDDAYWEAETGERADGNYDSWPADASGRVDWTWAGGATDGGVLGYLGEAPAVRIRPAFNEAAALYGDQYTGKITDWEFLTGDRANPDRIPLALDEPVAVAGPGTGEVTVGTGGSGGSGSDDGESGSDGGETPTDDGSTDDEETTTEPEETETETETDRPEETTETDGGDGENDDADDGGDDGDDGDGDDSGGDDDRDENDEREEWDDDWPGRGREEGRGNGHAKGRGKGHEKGRGKGHEKGRGRDHRDEGGDEERGGDPGDGRDGELRVDLDVDLGERDESGEDDG